MGDIGLVMEQVCFVVEETTKGTAVYPSAVSEKVIGAGQILINQQPTYSDSEEIADSLDVLDRFQDQVGAGTFTLPVYIRPSGTAGTPPMGKFLFESLMGTETISAGTSVTYGQATTKPSFTLWVKSGHTVFFGTGACCDKMVLSAVNKGAAKAIFNGGFMKLGWAGTDTVNGAVSSSTTVTVVNGKRFTAGAYVQIDTDTNSGAGYKINSVSGNDLTMADSITCSDGVTIKGYLPTYTAVGSPVENKNTSITIGGSSATLKAINLDYTSPAIYQTEEITTSGYPEDYVEDRRNITAKLDMLFRQSTLEYFYDGLNNVSQAVVITIGTSAGSICTINLPYSEIEVPEIAASAPTISLSANLKALGSSGEDSCTIVFT